MIVLSFDNIDSFIILPLLATAILITSLVFNCIFISRLIKSINEIDLDSTNRFSLRLKYYILCQGLSFIPSVTVSIILAFNINETLGLILNSILALTCYRSFIFIYIYGCTEGLKSNVKDLKLFSKKPDQCDKNEVNISNPNTNSTLNVNDCDFEKECDKNFNCKMLSLDRKRGRDSDVFSEYQIN